MKSITFLTGFLEVTNFTGGFYLDEYNYLSKNQISLEFGRSNLSPTSETIIFSYIYL